MTLQLPRNFNTLHYGLNIPQFDIWPIGLRNVASYDVDAQKGFTPLCPKELPVPDGHNIADELNRNAMLARFRVGSRDMHNPNALWITDDPAKIGTPLPQELRDRFPNIDMYWPAHCLVGTEGSELIDGLPQMTAYDFMALKGIETFMHPYGGLYHDLGETLTTGMKEFLKMKQIKVVILGGLATEYCDYATWKQLVDADFCVIVNKAAMRGIDPAKVQATLQEMEKHPQTIVVESTEEIVDRYLVKSRL